MPNIFEALAVPAGDGVGAWTNVAAMGKEKTITITGTAPFGTITIEVSNDAGTGFAPLVSATNSKRITKKVCCQTMRVRRSGGVAGTVEVNVAANDDGVQIQNLPVSAGDGVGATQDVDELGEFWTVVVDAAFSGTVTIEISQDSNNFEPLMSFTKSGTMQIKSPIIAAYARVRRSGVIAPAGTPNVDIAAENDDESLVNLFGDGADGDVTLGGNIALTRDMYYSRLDTAGFDIITAGFRIFVQKQMNIMGDSVISHNGADAVADAAGAALAAAVLGESAAGGAGATGAGAAGGAIAQCLGGAAGAAGTGNGGASAAGAAGAKTAPTANEGFPQALISSFSGRTIDGTIYKGGTGGGGGGGDGAADEGGGGGGGGGVVMINAKEINFEHADATISANGGAGADGTAANCGGGGGGGGGSVIINYRKLDNTLGTIEAAGGALGAGVSNGTDGTVGGAGSVYTNQL